ncbi:MAG: phosphate ABC transporter permease PstA [Peptococcaceae bacterium]
MLTKIRGRREQLINGFLWTAAFSTVIILILILSYILLKGIGHISLQFLTDRPRRMGAEGGIFPVIVGTLYFVALTIMISTPIGVGAAIYLNEYTKEGPLTRIIRFGTELLAGIPSIIFGLFGYAFFVVLLHDYTQGWSLLSGALTATCMILPTMVRTSEEALKTVPRSYREGSLSLGANKWQTIYKVVLPTALPGILTGVILGIGRAIGETAALLLTLGGSLLMPKSIFHGARTLSMHLYMVAMETGNMEAAFGTGVVLVFTILFINFMANFAIKRLVARNR